MGKYTRNEFAAFLGIDKNPRQIIKSNIDRGKIILDSNGMIDDRHPVNADFKKRYLDIRKEKTAQPVQVQQPVQVVQQPQTKSRGSKKLEKVKEKTEISKYELEIEKTQAEIEKKLVDTELARIKLAVLAGGNIPIPMVKTIMATLGKSISNNYKSFQDQLITEFCHENGMSNEQRTKILAKAVAGLNSIHSKAIAESKVQLKNAIGNKQTELALEDETE